MAVVETLAFDGDGDGAGHLSGVRARFGEVVAEFSARGGRAQWDGRDRSQQFVPSGLYLVVAVGENGEGTAFGKVAVVR